MDKEELEYDYIFKILLIGDSGVGKSSILLRYTDDCFQEDQTCTIGVDFKVKTLDIRGKRINLTMWDTAGQEKFRSITTSYYRGTHGIVLVYDVNSRKSFEAINTWLSEVDLYATNPDLIKLLIGNKVDQSNREVTKEEGNNFAREKQMLFMECSAKTKVGIQAAFDELVSKIMETPALYEASKPRHKSTTNTVLTSERQPDTSASYCC
eukprot:TRINITY_DN3186_c0_g1_i1.p1 TRINITY_DN3186_c0_g1~~TRINITY_DN3186_c0_g1_i1.p1  ORF type:complete len:209 (+),score=27.64 TRINITY_DN3186_c0_g1_i1:118-744(+)